MSVEPYSLDANVLFYAVDRDAGPKHQLASQLLLGLRRRPSMLATQTLAETYWSVQRKRTPLRPDVHGLLAHLVEYVEIVTAQPSDLLASMEVHALRPVHFWDAMLATTLRRSGCRILLTEDLQDRPRDNDLIYINPFAVPPSELASFLP